MLFANDPFERVGFDALDDEGAIALQVADLDEIEDLDWLLEQESVDGQLEQVDGKIFHGWY